MGRDLYLCGYKGGYIGCCERRESPYIYKLVPSICVAKRMSEYRSSDNGSAYTATETQQFASNRYIDWKFNLEGAAWFGGMWERLVGSVKRCVKKVVGVKTISFVELQTLIFEIELILSNRPIDAGCVDAEPLVVWSSPRKHKRILFPGNGALGDRE